MTKEKIELAIKKISEMRDYYDSLILDEESPEDDPTNEADMLEALNLSLALLRRELQFFDEECKNRRIEYHAGGRKFMVTMSQTEYKPLTPTLRGEINEEINKKQEELSTCKDNVYVMAQRNAYEAIRGLINSLPDGYLVPMRVKA